MSKRDYKASRRAESTAETRRRLVEATFALHSEQGIAATSMKQIAERAGVGVGTVYHHFPTYEEAIQACGEHAAEIRRAPDEAIFTGIDAVPDRVRVLARELFASYDRLPVLERVRCDQHLVPMLRAVVEAEERHRLALAATALRVPPEARHARLAAALLDIGVCRALRRAGFATPDAAEEAARLILSAPAT